MRAAQLKTSIPDNVNVKFMIAPYKSLRAIRILDY